MNRCVLAFARGFVMVICGLSARSVLADSPQRFNLAEHGMRLAWADAKTAQATPVASWSALPAGARCAGAAWQEARDVSTIRVKFAGGTVPEGLSVQYWFRTWPDDPPHMPTIEDPVDDLWQGQWLTARTEAAIDGGLCTLTFKPLAKDENPRAEHLPGVTYRRTLKARLVLPKNAPTIESLEMHSDSVLKPISIRIEFDAVPQADGRWDGRLEIFNGEILSVKPWGFGEGDAFEPPCSWRNLGISAAKGVTAEILATDPAPAGSHDVTIVTVRATKTPDGPHPRTFSFSTLDLDNGPIRVPYARATVTRADDPNAAPPKPSAPGGKIRDHIPREPEHTFERATREIPPQDPWERQRGDKVYLPVAADSSWQKFAVEYGGDVFVNKRLTKAKGAEFGRLQWEGDTIRFRFGTGDKPYYREDRRARVSVLDEHLPVVINRWENEGLAWEEEAFATLLSGPLDPNDPGWSEQTPAVCMVRLTATNPGPQPREARLWFSIEPAEQLRVSGHRVYATGNAAGAYETPRLRAVIRAPGDAPGEVVSLGDAAAPKNTVAVRFTVPAGASETLYAHLPFVSDVTGPDADRLVSLSYEAERQRVVAYWRAMIDRTTRFTVPEPKFNHLARFVVPHIHISTTKDPKSGLFMVPAASYGYQVFANETCFQVLMLDALGDTERATQYLKTLTDLQGTRSFPGNYPGPHDGVFHGARVDKDYDYTASSYGLDHGTVLWALARHYFFTRDAAWLDDMLPHMFKAVEWIERQRAATKRQDTDGQRVLEYGLLPAGHLEDNSDWGYWFAVNAYCSAGMTEMARALDDIHHPQATEMRHQAHAYLDDLRTAVRRSTELAPVVRMRDGTYSPYVPTRGYQRFRYFGPLRVQYYSRYGLPDVLPCYRLSATREVLYGPMILLNLDIFSPDEPIADWILNDWEDNLTMSSSGGFNVHGFTDDNLWFSQGGMVFQSNLQNPIYVYLMRREIPAAIRGTYNGFVSCLYPEVNTLTEEYRMWSRASGPFYKSPDEARFVNRLRDMLVLEAGDELWLAVGAPRRWVASKEGIRVDRIQSCFGPVAYTLRAGDDPNTVVATVTPPSRPRPKRVWLHTRLPDGKRITSVRIDGREWSEFDAAQERILLPPAEGPLDVLVRY